MKTPSHRFGRTLPFAAGACLAALLLACSGFPTGGNAAPATGNVGQRVVAGDIALTVDNVKRAKELSKTQKAPEGKEYLVAEVTIENSGASKLLYGPANFKVKDGKGVETTVELNNSASDALKDGSLDKGDKIHGTVAFEMDPAATGLVLTFEPVVFFGQSIKITLDK
jgi:hypothetical protein